MQREEDRASSSSYNRGMKAAFHTFGCKLNQYETEALASAFRDQGFSLVGADQVADVYLINTCTVTTKSEQKARRLIRKISRENPEALVVVTGCYAQLNPEQLDVLGENICVVSQEQKAELLELPRLLEQRGTEPYKSGEGLIRRQEPSADPFGYRVERFSYHSRAFLKVQDGCDYGCSYCRVPLARGRSISLEPEEAVRRAVRLEQRGYREVVLTGVNLTAYRYGDSDLSALLAAILDRTQQLRLRLSSLEPEMIKSELAEIIRDPRIRPHFHIPVQSGSDRVLLVMRRRYRAEQVVRAVELLRGAKHDPFLAADVIVGFPGETDADFRASYELVESLGLSKLHVFPFSPRPGTAEEHPRHPVPERIRDERAHELLALSRSLHKAYTDRWIGKTVEVVLEAPGVRASGVRASGTWRGLSENYLRVLTGEVPETAARAGSLIRARIHQPGDPCRAGFVEIP